MRLIPDKRKRLLELVENILQDDLVLDSNWRRWAESEESILKVEHELIHLLMQFLQKGKIIFREGQETQDTEELIVLLKDFKKDLEDMRDLDIEKKNNQGASVRVLQMLSHRMQIILDSVHKDENEIRELVEKEFGLSEGKEWDFRDDSMVVEFHPRVRMTTYEEGKFILKDEEEPYLFIFENDYLVGAIQGEFKGNTFVEESTTEMYLRYKDYIARTISLLFRIGKIEKWKSQDPLSQDEKESYLALRDDPGVYLKRVGEGFLITQKG